MRMADPTRTTNRRPSTASSGVSFTRFARSAYVGYTATPFANIFIHERGATKQEGPDLFPAAFIVNLAAPSDYVGSAKMFGGGGENVDALDLVRIIDDYSGADGTGWMPLRHKNGHVPRYLGGDRLPPSLNEAIDAFVLACAARRARGPDRAAFFHADPRYPLHLCSETCPQAGGSPGYVSFASG